jgi:hypothetical protein
MDDSAKDSIHTKSKNSNPDRDDENQVSADENQVSVKESQIKDLIDYLYTCRIKSRPSASSAPLEPYPFLSRFIEGFKQGLHKTDSKATNDTKLDLQNYINFIIDKIIDSNITFDKYDKYVSSILLLTKLIVAISTQLNIHINKILGVIVLGDGHGGRLTITPEQNTLLNERVNIIEFLPTVAENTYGYFFTLNVAKDAALKLYERKGKTLSHEQKEFYREYCFKLYNYVVKKHNNYSNSLDRLIKDLKKIKNTNIEEKKNALFLLCSSRKDIRLFCEKDLYGNKIDSIENIFQSNNHFTSIYENLINKAKQKNDMLIDTVHKGVKSFDTKKMLLSFKSTTEKKRMCEQMQILSSGKHDSKNANMYTLFYVLSEFTESYSIYAHMIECMMNRILSKFQIRRKSLNERAKDTQPKNIFQNKINGFDKFENFEREILENTEKFYDFAYFLDQENIEKNIDGFSYLFITYLDRRVNSEPTNPDNEEILQWSENVYINPANFMSMIGKIVPNIKTTYIYNACRETNTDNPEFNVPSSENTPIPTPSGTPSGTPSETPSGTPRKSVKRTHDESPSDSQNKTRRVSPGTESNQTNSSIPGGSRRRKHRYSTRRKRSNKSYRKYSIGNKKQTK